MMGAAQTRLFFAGLIAVFIGISYNALYNQSPAARSAKLEAKNVIRIAQPRLVKRSNPKRNPLLITGSTNAQKVQPAAPTKLTKAVQRELKAKGYYQGHLDGVAGPVTLAAIMAFQDDYNMPITARASNTLLKRIVFGASGAVKTKTGTKIYSLTAQKFIFQLQKQLAELGYDPGTLDGKLGVQTRNAIKSFEKDRELKVTGRISGKVISEIIKVSGKTIRIVE